MNDFQPLITTHVIADKPTQSEKYMSACAAGVWVLHAMYLRACERTGEWVDEAPFEWYSFYWCFYSTNIFIDVCVGPWRIMEAKWIRE